MLKPLALLPLVLLFIVIGCQKKPPSSGQPPSGSPPTAAHEEPAPGWLDQADQAYFRGEYSVAVEGYERVLDRASNNDNEDRLLFRLGLLYLLPGENFRPERAQIVLGMLIDEHPSSEYALLAPLLLELQKRLVGLKERTQQQDQAISALTRQLERLKEIDLKRKPPGR